MRLTRLLPPAVLVAVTAVALLSELDRYLSLESLRDNRQFLQDFVAGHRVGTALANVAAYAALSDSLDSGRGQPRPFHFIVLAEPA